MQKSSNFTAKRLALIAMLSALAFVISRLTFPIFPAVPFLELDFSFSILLLGGFMLGGFYGGVTVVVMQLIALIFTKTGGVGELTNIVLALSFILMPAILYERKKGLKIVIITIIISTILQTVVALIFNKYISFPLFLGQNAQAVFNSSLHYLIAFNIIKGGINGFLTILLYKRVKHLFSRFL